MLFALLYVSQLVSLGQGDQSNVRFTQGQADESATVSLGVPLGGYPGRGISLPVGLTYSSKVWRIEHLATVKTPDINGIRQSVTQALYSEYSKAGWKSSLDLPQIEWPKIDEVYDYKGRPANPGWNYRIARVVIHMPDGSVHELRKSDHWYTSSSVDVSGTFYAVDGSRLRYDSTDAETGTLHLPDGTRYVLDAGSGQVIDRNGNTISYDGSTRQWTDTLGRVIANPIPANPAAQDYTYNLPGLTGVNGGLQTYTFKWRNLADALTPDSSNNAPALRYTASHYLPYPGSAPTNADQSNYPQAQSTTYQSLFQSAYLPDEDPGNPNPNPVPTLVVGPGQSAGQLFNPVVLTEVVLPDGTSYKFTYNVYGELDKVVYPTAAYELYSYGATILPQDEIKQPYVQASNRRITSRKLSVDGLGDDTQEWQYTESSGSSARVTSIVAPDNTLTEIYKKDIPEPGDTTGRTYWPFGIADAANGMVFERRTYSASTDPNGGTLLRRELTQFERSTYTYTYTASGITPTYTKTVSAYRNARPSKQVSILFEGSGPALAQTTTFAYDTTNEFTTGVDQTQVNVYNFAVVSNNSSSDTAQAGSIDDISSGSLAKYTATSYLTSSTYRDANILGLPTSVEVRDPAGTIVSRSEMSYDDSGYVPASTNRGLPTSLKTWDSTKGAPTNSSAYLTTHATFDQYGNRTVATDAMGNSTTTTYDSTYHAFPVVVTSPVPDSSGTYGSSSAFTTSTSFDYTTGLTLSTTDANGQTTTVSYFDPVTGVGDPLLRPRVVTAPNGQQTITEYGAGTSEATRWVKVKTQIDSNFWSEAVSFYDGVGRTFQTQKTDSNGDIYADTEYDTMGRVKRSTNPYRAGETKQYTTPEYDDLGRTKKVTSPDTNDVQVVYGLSTSGVIGTTKTITDQAGRKRTGITDALGNMVRVIEDPDAVSPATPLTTDYVFDALGNLRKTTQGEQVRYFSYDSLGRVLRAKQVEQDANTALALSTADPVTGNNSWTVGYSYDDNGNILTTTDAKGQTITATYDHLNRLTYRDYSDTATPDVTFYYDGTGLGGVPNYSKGKTTRVASSVAEMRNTSFDSMGRLLASEQRTTDEQLAGTQTPYTFGYSYNLSGALIEETYPSGRVLKNTLNADGELSQVQSKKDASHGYFTYADSFAYNSAAAVTKMQLGNGHWETATFNERLQVTQIGLGTTSSTQDLLRLDFEYEGPNPSSSVGDRNNGSMRKQTITVPAVGGNPTFTAIQTYTYDSLNRIHAAAEAVSSVQSWKQTFSYDRYGNRRFDAANTTTLGSCSAVCNPDISTSNNRLSSTQGYGYDANGSLIQDATGQRFGYDAESHQKEFFDASNNTSTPDATYQYDGEGKRVKKVVGAEVTIFVYDASGLLAAEYSTTVEPAATAKVSYLTTDHLGSPRIITDQVGAVTSRKDFAAFGEEVTSPQRTSGQYGNGYDPSNVRHDYTGYQNDGESRLEYARARYYNSSHGRFTSPDPLSASASTRNPQTFNRYSYVLNNPYKFVDPLGLMFGTPNPDSGIYLTTDATLPGTLDRVWFHNFTQATQPPPPPWDLRYRSRSSPKAAPKTRINRTSRGPITSRIWLRMLHSRNFLPIQEPC